MKFLLDHCVTEKLLAYLPGLEISTAYQMGWEKLSNGRLLKAAEDAGFTCLITVDKGFRHQQNIVDRRITVILLDTPDVRIAGLIPLLPQLQVAMGNLSPGVVLRCK